MPSRYERAAAGTVLALVLTAGPALAQVSANVEMDLGSHFALDGVINSSDRAAFAEWSVNGDGAQDFDISFTLPTDLDDGSGGLVPITVGTTSAVVVEGATQTVFDPNTGTAYTAGSSSPSFSVTLGEDVNGDGSGDATVDLTGADPGTYTGTITMTVTVL